MNDSNLKAIPFEIYKLSVNICLTNGERVLYVDA
jgi:hypothetical protein